MATTPTTLSVGVTSDVGAVANALASVFKLGDAIFEALNSPQMLALRQTQEIQALLQASDVTAKAAEAGDKAAQAKLDAEVTG